MIRLILRRRCDHCGQRTNSRVLYGGEQWCAPCAISDARYGFRPKESDRG